MNDYKEKLGKNLEKTFQKESNWQYTEVILTLFVVAFFVLFAIRPAVVAISGLIGEIEDKKNLTQEMGLKINNIILAQEQYALVQEKHQVIESFLPSDFNLGTGLAQVLGTAKDGQVSIQNLGISDLEVIEQEKKKGNLAGVKFNFSTEGGYQDLKAFIKQLTETRRWTQLDQYQILEAKRERGETVEEAGLNLVVSGQILYWRNYEPTVNTQ